jgi:hypothetical protein
LSEAVTTSLPSGVITDAESKLILILG